MVGEGFSEIMKKNKKKRENFIPTLFGAGIFWIYYDFVFRVFFNLPSNAIVVGLCWVFGGFIGSFLHKIYLKKKNKKQKEIFLWGTIITIFLIFVISFVLKFFLK